MASMLIQIRREPFSDYYQLTLPNGNSEEIPCEEIYEWFRLRGANPDVVERAADEIWNFYSGNVLIKEYREPAVVNPRTHPNV